MKTFVLQQVEKKPAKSQPSNTKASTLTLTLTLSILSPTCKKSTFLCNMFSRAGQAHFTTNSSEGSLLLIITWCHLIYALDVWSSATSSSLQPLYVKQKAAVRIKPNKK